MNIRHAMVMFIDSGHWLEVYCSWFSRMWEE